MLLLLLAPVWTGCASNQALRASLADRDDLIHNLRAENQAIKERIQDVTYDRDLLQQALSDQAVQGGSTPIAASMERDLPVDRGPAIDTTGFADLGISMDRMGDAIVFRIPSSTTFASGSASLSHDGEAALNLVIPQLKNALGDGALVYVEGHTDSEQIKRSKFTTNRDLSYSRARAVHDYLVERGRIEDARFVVVAHGPHAPLDTNETAQGRARNRRVEIVVRKP
ncbi:MAG: OmpA family protein [Planctomycetota bacterium]